MFAVLPQPQLMGVPQAINTSLRTVHDACSWHRLHPPNQITGGLAIGGALALAPRCCAAALLDVPFLDVLGAMEVGELLDWTCLGNVANVAGWVL